MKHFTTALTFFSLSALIFSCEKNFKVGDSLLAPKLPAQPFDYTTALTNAPHWFTDTVMPARNPVTNNGATLGRVLFYDKILSLNNSVACASCHQAQFGFADSRAFSIGYQLQTTARNAMPIINPTLSSSFFWDTRVAVLEDMVLKPVQNHIEMGIEDLDHLVVKLGMAGYYAPLFEKAFGASSITQEKIADALAQYLRSMVTYNSRYDEGKEINCSNFTAGELRGRTLFFDVLPCGNCHDKDRLGGKGITANVGLDFDYSDNGLMDITGSQAQDGDFKIPSLRNIALTAPYMHDGRFSTLEEVVRFYSSAITANPNLSFPLSENVTVVTNDGYGSSSTVVVQPQPVVPLLFNLTDQDVGDIVSFLNTLTDYSFITEEKFSDPFRY